MMMAMTMKGMMALKTTMDDADDDGDDEDELHVCFVHVGKKYIFAESAPQGSLHVQRHDC